MGDISPTTTKDSGVDSGELSRGVRKRRARPWHRLLGVLLVLPLVWVVVTGAVLNHTVDWKLDQVMIDYPLVLQAYRMVPNGEPVAVEVGAWEVVQWDGLVFVNGEVVSVPGRLVGAVADGEGVAVVTSTHVLRVHSSGEVLETLDELSLPALPLTGVSAVDGGLLLRNADGWHSVEKDWLEFMKVDRDVQAQQAGSLSSSKADRLRSRWAQGGLPLSRVLLDAHAGHFLGAFSKYFYDFVAIATVWLCVSGLILFFRKPKRTR